MNVKNIFSLILCCFFTFQVKASLPTPGAVENLRAIKNNGTSVWQGSDVTFNWDAPNYSGPLTYTIELQEPNKNKWTWKSGWASTEKTRPGMNTVGTYNFWVRACNTEAKCGSASLLSVDVVALEVAGLTAIKNNGSSVWQGSDMTFKWDKPNGYTKSLTYTIELQEPDKNRWTWQSAWSTTSKVRSSMNTIGTYNFWVKACNEYGSCGSASNLSVNVVPLTITGLTAIKNNGNSVFQGSDMTFKWNKPNGYTKPLTYTIELQEPSENKWTWQSAWSTTSKVRSNMNTIGTYNFWVRACNEYGSCGSASHLSVNVVESTISLNVSFDVNQEGVVVSLDNPGGFTYELIERLLYADRKRVVEQKWDVGSNEMFTLQRISGVYEYVIKATNIINQAVFFTVPEHITVGFGSKDLDIFSYENDENLTRINSVNDLERAMFNQDKYGGTVSFDGPSSFTVESRTNTTCNNGSLSGSECAKAAVYMRTIPEPLKDIDDREIVIEFDFEVLNYDWTNWPNRNAECLTKDGGRVVHNQQSGDKQYKSLSWILFQDWNRLHGTTEANGGTIANNDFINGNAPISSLEIVRKGKAGDYEIYLRQVQRAASWNAITDTDADTSAYDSGAHKYYAKNICENEALYAKVVGEVLIGSQDGNDIVPALDNIHIKIQINDSETQTEGMKVWVNNNLISDEALTEYRTSAYKNGENKQDHSYMIGIYSTWCGPERCFNSEGSREQGENLKAKISNLTFKGLY